jgi:hypothetical protein
VALIRLGALRGACRAVASAVAKALADKLAKAGLIAFRFGKQKPAADDGGLCALRLKFSPAATVAGW